MPIRSDDSLLSCWYREEEVLLVGSPSRSHSRDFSELSFYLLLLHFHFRTGKKKSSTPCSSFDSHGWPLFANFNTPCCGALPSSSRLKRTFALVKRFPSVLFLSSIHCRCLLVFGRSLHVLPPQYSGIFSWIGVRPLAFALFRVSVKKTALSIPL